MKQLKQAAILTLTIALLLTGAAPLLAWGAGHRYIREWSVSKLPDWQHEYFGEENLKRLCVDYKSLQDQYAGSRNPDLAPYVVTPGVKHRVHNVYAPESSILSIEWLLDNIIENMRAGEVDEAMKFLGVLCHWNEDPGSPSAHAVRLNEPQIRQLVPPANDKIAARSYIFGYMGQPGMDARRNNLDPNVPYTPQLLGSTVAEAAARIYQHQRLLENHAASCIVPAMVARNEGDEERFKSHIDRAAIYNGKHVADIIYTVGCLAADQFDSAEVRATHEQHLADWLPTNHFGGDKLLLPPPYFNLPYLVNRSFTPARDIEPLRLVGEEGDIEKGFGTGHKGEVTFAIRPGQVFDRLRTRVGVHPSAGEKGRLTFEVIVNDQTLATVGPLDGTQPAEAIDIELPEADQLDIVLRTMRDGDGPVTHALGVWAEPMLLRNPVD